MPSSGPLGFIHRFVPGTPGSKQPVFLLLHGTGGNEDDLLELGGSLCPGAALLSPRGKILESGVTPRFFRRLAEGVFDEADLVHRTHELADFVQAAAEVYGFIATEVVALGYSNIAASLLLLRPGALRGAVLLRPMVPLVPETLSDLKGLPVFLASGRADPIIPVENVEHLAAMLRQTGAEVSTHWSGGGHQLTSADLQAAQRWLEQNFPR